MSSIGLTVESNILPTCKIIFVTEHCLGLGNFKLISKIIRRFKLTSFSYRTNALDYGLTIFICAYLITLYILINDVALEQSFEVCDVRIRYSNDKYKLPCASLRVTLTNSVLNLKTCLKWFRHTYYKL